MVYLLVFDNYNANKQILTMLKGEMTSTYARKNKATIMFETCSNSMLVGTSSNAEMSKANRKVGKELVRFPLLLCGRSCLGSVSKHNLSKIYSRINNVRHLK